MTADDFADHVDSLRQAGGLTDQQVRTLVNWIADFDGDTWTKVGLIADLRDLARMSAVPVATARDAATTPRSRSR